jgi:SAM-dependent methyltransferase
MIPGATNSKYALRQHLQCIGYVMDQPPQAVAQEFARHMGPQRYAEYQRIGAAMHTGGAEAQNRIYDFMRDLREANLLRCMSPDVTLDTSYYLYERSLPLLKPGARVIELACWTGGFASFIAENHPDCTVVGVDRVPRILELDRAHYHMPNLSFTLWDYCHAKPDDLEPADVLLCSLGTNNDCPPGIYKTLDPLTVRGSEGYAREKKEASLYFTNWRQAAKDNAILATVLRVFTFPRFLAFMDAAQEGGWKPLAEHFAFVPCPANKESIPSLVFSAQPSEPMTEDTALSHWMRTCAGKPQLAQFAGPAALALYRSMGEKHVVAQREIRNPQGFAAREELGICGAFGYVYGQDVRPECQLVLIPIAEVEKARRTFSQPPQQQQRIGPGLMANNNSVMCGVG